MKQDLKEFEVYDGTNKVLGRLASQVAKRLMQGKKVAIINAEQCIISGNKVDIAAKYRTRLTLQEKENPEHSPYWPRRSDMLVRRIVRGMLPYHRKSTGKDAYKRLMVFNGVPSQLKGVKPIEIKSKNPKEMYSRYMTISELSKALGYESK
ncbi:MAG: 50S ribosomal protein L13 [Candidatus Marsarchaeota archaeon]|nr:50S ribosomal protein L13 [Candidatus Marsarchaeota archaeon]